MKQGIIVSILAALICCWMLPATADNAPQYYGESLCGYKGFKCVQVKPGDTWEKLFPDARERELVKRLNRTNMAIYHRKWIVVPTNMKELDITALSPFPDHIPAPGQKLIVVNLAWQAFGAYDQYGYLVHWGPMSGGKGYCNDINRPCTTVTGNYNVIRKQGASCVSNKFPVNTDGGAPMPFCMHFYRAYALHGSTLPGYHASHGCVRLFFEDAQWLNNDFADIGTRVVITQDGSDIDLEKGKYN